ncbi:MAG TPA: hypothetical protein VJ326_04890 [Thermoplasmata archaeon]|nr:hypothetical protein [Thermoplasmata archaeon]
MTSMTTDLVNIPRRAIARLRSAMALMGLGLATTTTGLGWDFYVHEIVKEAGESIFAAPHLLIFAGFGLTALGFLGGLIGVRPVLTGRPG